MVGDEVRFYIFVTLCDECNIESTVYSFLSTQHATHAHSCKNTTHMYEILLKSIVGGADMWYGRAHESTSEGPGLYVHRRPRPKR
jgi:hypothetical protein